MENEYNNNIVKMGGVILYFRISLYYMEMI